MEEFPAWKPTLVDLQITFYWVAEPTSSDCFRIAALLSFALSSFCVFLPSTPPARSDRGVIAPLQALQMFRVPTFSLLIGASVLLALVIPLYIYAVPNLLEQREFPAD